MQRRLVRRRHGAINARAIARGNAASRRERLARDARTPRPRRVSNKHVNGHEECTRARACGACKLVRVSAAATRQLITRSGGMCARARRALRAAVDCRGPPPSVVASSSRASQSTSRSHTSKCSHTLRSTATANQPPTCSQQRRSASASSASSSSSSRASSPSMPRSA